MADRKRRDAWEIKLEKQITIALGVSDIEVTAAKGREFISQIHAEDEGKAKQRLPELDEITWKELADCEPWLELCRAYRPARGFSAGEGPTLKDEVVRLFELILADKENHDILFKSFNFTVNKDNAYDSLRDAMTTVGNTLLRAYVGILPKTNKDTRRNERALALYDRISDSLPKKPGTKQKR